MKKIDFDDILVFCSFVAALVLSIGVSFTSSPIYKVLQAIALFVGLGSTIHRLITAKPFQKDVDLADWFPTVNGEFEYRINKREHKRGKTPILKAFEKRSGEMNEVQLDKRVLPNGDVVFSVASRYKLCLEVRK
jgi:hypothetical protein